MSETAVESAKDAVDGGQDDDDGCLNERGVADVMVLRYDLHPLAILALQGVKNKPSLHK